MTSPTSSHSPRCCDHCGAPLAPRPREAPSLFAKRRFCCRACAAAARRYTPEQELGLVAAARAGGLISEACRRLGIREKSAAYILARHGVPRRHGHRTALVKALLAAEPGLTDRALAERAGCHPDYVGKVRRGEYGGQPARTPAENDPGAAAAAAPTTAQRIAYLRADPFERRFLFARDVRAWMEYAA